MNANRGYSGWSMSNRAVEAYNEGFLPKTKFKQYYKLSEKKFQELLPYLETEWHHTSKFFNKTYFYAIGSIEAEMEYSILIADYETFWNLKEELLSVKSVPVLFEFEKEFIYLDVNNQIQRITHYKNEMNKYSLFFPYGQTDQSYELLFFPPEEEVIFPFENESKYRIPKNHKEFYYYLKNCYQKNILPSKDALVIYQELLCRLS